MDKVYDFGWMVNEIDNSIAIVLTKDNLTLSTYQISHILTGDMKQMEVKFANVEDLENFVLYAVVRFYDVRNRKNIIDIPVRKLKQIYENSNKYDSEKKKKKIKLGELECFSVVNDGTYNDDIAIEVISFDEISDGLKKIIDLCSKYGKMNMMEKFDALCDINLINYRIENNSACA